VKRWQWTLGLLLSLALLKAQDKDKQPKRRAGPDTPALAWAVAGRDIQGIYAHDAIYTRYLSLYNRPEKDAQRFIYRLLNYQVGLLNTRPKLPRLEVVPNSGNRLLRLDLRDLAFSRKDLDRLVEVWEQLANVEPIYHIQLRVVEFYDAQGKRLSQRSKPIRRKDAKKFIAYQPGHPRGRYAKAGKQEKIKFVPALAPWLSDDPRDERPILDILLYSRKQWQLRWPGASQEVHDIERLVFKTGSAVPGVDATWFFVQTAVSTERDANNPGYDEFLGVKNQDDYERLIGFSRKVHDKFTRPLLEATNRSGVKKDGIRRIERYAKIDGAYHLTKDAIKAVDKANPLRNVNSSLEFNATEAFGHKADGLWLMGLFDNKRVAQRSAPDFVGFDKTSSSHDGRIEKPLSCLRCHTNGGLHDYKQYFRDLYNNSPERLADILGENLPPLALGSPDREILNQLQDEYLRPLERYFTADRQIYEDAVYEITEGWDSKQLAKNYALAWKEWHDDDVGIREAASWIGISPRRFQATLAATLKETGAVDPVLAIYLRPAKHKLGVPFDAFWEAFALAMFAMRGKSPLDFVNPEDDRIIKRFKRKR
jgi:hypothetical protein